MDYRDFGAVPIFDTKEEELEWQQQEEKKLIAEEKKLGRPLTTPLRELSNRKKSIQIKTLRGGDLVGKRIWLVDQFVALGAVVLLAAEKGAGKTALLLRLIEAVCKGGLFMNQLSTKKGKVLLIQCDEPEEDTYSKLRRMGLPDGICDVVWLDETLDLNFLQEQIDTGDYLLIILDSATKGLASDNCEVTDTGFTRKLYKIGKMFAKAKVSAIITTHLNQPIDKKERQMITAHDVAGLSSIGNAISDLWGLVRVPQTQDQFRLICLGKRNCIINTLWEIAGNVEDYSFDLVKVGVNDLLPTERKKLRDRISDYLKEGGCYCHPRSIAVGLSPISEEETVRRYLAEMYSEGLVKRKKIHVDIGRPKYEYAIE